MHQPTSNPAAAPAGPAAPAGGSIREQFMRNLARERGDAPSQAAPAPAQAPASPPQPRQQAPVAEQDAAPADELENPELPEEELAELPEEGEPEEGDDEGLTPEQIEIRAEIERLKKREKEMTSDYTRKTMRIAEAGRQLEQDAQVVRSTAQMIAGFIEQPLRQFDQVPWAQLQTQDPARYQQIRAQYEQVVTANENMLQLISQMEQQQDEALERHRMQVAEVSKDILRTKIPDWSNQKYVELRDLAVSEFGYSPEEVDRNIDHRFMEMLYRVHQTQSAATKLTKVTRKAPQQKPAAPNRQTLRNESGQYQNARQALQSRPGDRNIARQMFAAKLAAERRGK